MTETMLDFEDAAPRQGGVPRASHKTRPAGQKMKIGWVALSYIISAIAFAVFVVLFSIDGGRLDYEWSRAISTIPFFQDLGRFMNPSPFWGLFEHLDEIGDWFNDTWGSGNIGQIFSEVFIFIAAILMITILIQYGVAKAKATTQYIADHPDVAGDGKKAKLTKEQRAGIKVALPPTTRYFKYAIFIVLLGIAVIILTQVVFKRLYGRPRPGAVDVFLEVDAVLAWLSTTDLTSVPFFPFYIPSGSISGINTESFWSGHTAQSAIMTAVALSFIGSRKKWLAPVLGIGTATYVVLMGLGRVGSGSHWLSDTVFGGFMVYTVALFLYYAVLNIPSQEAIHRYRLVHTPYNEGYALLLEAKGLMISSPDAAVEKASAGLQRLAEAREKVNELAQHGHDYAALGERIDDITRRVGSLLQSRSDAKQWSYIC